MISGDDIETRARKTYERHPAFDQRFNEEGKIEQDAIPWAGLPATLMRGRLEKARLEIRAEALAARLYAARPVPDAEWGDLEPDAQVPFLADARLVIRLSDRISERCEGDPERAAMILTAIEEGVSV